MHRRRQTGANGKYRSQASIAGQLGHTSIALLKMDSTRAPMRRWRGHAGGNWPLSETQVLGTGDIALGALLLADPGHVVIRREDSQNCILVHSVDGGAGLLLGGGALFINGGLRIASAHIFDIRASLARREWGAAATRP